MPKQRWYEVARSHELVVWSAFFELCWGFWILQNPTNGTARVFSDMGGAGVIIATLYILQGIFRFISAIRNNLTGIIFHNAIGVFTFTLMAAAVISAQTPWSMLSLLYVVMATGQLNLAFRYALIYHIVNAQRGSWGRG